MGRYMAAELIESGFFQGIDVIIPIPLHETKQRIRGYNQSEWIARGIAAVTGIPVDTEAVVAVVGAQKEHGTVVVTAHLRIHPEHIGNTMGDRRCPIDFCRIDIHRRTGFSGIYPGTGRDNHY